MSASEQEMERARSRVRNRLYATNGSWTREESDADLDLILALGALRERRRLGPWLRHDGMVPADSWFGDREACRGGDDCTCGLTAALEEAPNGR